MKVTRPFPQGGDLRQRRVFLFLPKTEYFHASKIKIVRWWEWAMIEEEYISDWGDTFWNFKRFVD